MQYRCQGAMTIQVEATNEAEAEQRIIAMKDALQAVYGFGVRISLLEHANSPFNLAIEQGEKIHEG